MVHRLYQAKSLLKQKVASLPLVSGVYLFKDITNNIIYVGKAKILRNRVKSYFQDNLDPTSKTKALVDNIADISYIEALSEFEALLLEAELIKKHKPKYNINLKDDKSYLYIIIRSEKMILEGKKQAIPKILAVRKSDLLLKDITFGPYPDAGTVKYVLRTIRKIFPYRDCSLSKFNRYHSVKHPCLFGHLSLCQAPCVGKNSLSTYKKEIQRIKKLLLGESRQLLNGLRRLMRIASVQKNYEEAIKYRNILQKFDYIRQNFKSAQTYIDNPYLVEDLIAAALQELKKHIVLLQKIPQRIECYDISNISGKDAVGSMVVATDGRIDKSQYRKFKIKLKNKPDDFGMLQEVVRRRLKNNWEVPDLMVIDGGKGQVSSVLEVLAELTSLSNIAVIGLAKKLETVVFYNPVVSSFVELNLPFDNPGLNLLQRLRDEAHRFAQKYHHQLRLQKIKL